jgi:hypothetical protein
MIERVAKRLIAEHDENGGWLLTEGEAKRLARAAIEAMREPTKAMILAGDNEKENCVDEDTTSDADGNQYNYTTIRSDISSRIFSAMIDAALNLPEPPK